MRNIFFRALSLLSTGLFLWLLIALPTAVADESPAPHAASASSIQDVLDSLHFQTGNITIAPAKATLHLQPGYGFLDAADAQRVLTDLWNNPPDSDVLGLILHGTDASAITGAEGWAIVVTYSNDGYVSDNDAAKIHYDELLTQMQKDVHDSNAERLKQGYHALRLVGWAEAPHYDSISHKLYWARDIEISNAAGEVLGHSLNYDIRILGRHGYLSLNALAPMDQLEKVRTDMPQVLAMTDFDDGSRYADYNSKTDKLAAYGIAALVAGGIAAKAGLFAKLGLMLLALKKFVIIALAAIAAFARKLFNRAKTR